jgi:hypothetical protein
MFISTKQPISRRTVLKAGAVSVALPILDAMKPSSIHAASVTKPPKRIVLVHRPLGTYHPHLVPAEEGLKYQATRYLKKFEEHRGNFTLLSGVAHLGYPNGHWTDAAIFTGTYPEGIARSDNIHNTVSIDQLIAEKIGHYTRVSSLTLNTANCASLSWNRKGVPVPFLRSRSQLFKRLFVDGTEEEVTREIERLKHGHSILDDMRGQLKLLSLEVGAGDKSRLDLLTTSIREAEMMLQQDEAWVAKPKPKVDATEKDFARDDTWVESQEKWYRLIQLALQTDSTRVITYGLGEQNNNGVPGLEIGHHDASHHGKNPEKIEQFARYEEKEYEKFAKFLSLLDETDEGNGSLLDNTQVMLTSNLGDASAHASSNLPTFIAGGGYKHKGHLAFDKEKNYPLSNMFLRMIQRFDIDIDKFGSSASVLSELG